MGMPIIAYSGASAGIQCTSGKHFLEARSSEEFVQYTLELLRNPSRAEALAIAGRTLVKENFSWESRAEAYERLYRELTERQRG